MGRLTRVGILGVFVQKCDHILAAESTQENEVYEASKNRLRFHIIGVMRTCSTTLEAIVRLSL